jgi:hypothetical protein
VPRTSRSAKLLDNAESALISAIEIYNKPDFHYREETFAILTLNSWELLLKAKLLAGNGNRPRTLFIYDRRLKKDGTQSAKKYVRRNRSGNIYTIGLREAINNLESDPETRLTEAVKANIDAITEIRDNAVHFVNASSELAKLVLEIGTASVVNFVELTRRWFGSNLSRYNLYLMPIGFLSDPSAVTGVNVSSDEQRLISHLNSLRSIQDGSDDSTFSVAIEVNLSFKRSSPNAAATFVSAPEDPKALPVALSEEDMRTRYPWEYSDLMARCSTRYKDFKVNSKFHGIRQQLHGDSRYVYIRSLDPRNPSSSTKVFYNPNILKIFDENYSFV